MCFCVVCVLVRYLEFLFFFFKQKTAYEMRISDWSSDVCSSDLTVLQGGTAVVAKRLGNVAVTFAEGQVRSTGRGQASAYVDRAAATLPADIQERITRKRKPGDQDAEIGRAHV